MDRSVIPISGNDNDVLKFDSYYFLDGSWREGIMADTGEVKFWQNGGGL